MWIGKVENYIIYEDKDILVCHKPAGIAVQNARIGSADLESMLKNYLVYIPKPQSALHGQCEQPFR